MKATNRVGDRWIATPEYGAWSRMRIRCQNPASPDYGLYGGRGIKVCERWLNSFQNFYEDMGARPSVNHSIDRINNDGNYTPENCRWATIDIQNRNRRDNINITYKGETMVLLDWAQVLGIPYKSLWRRFKSGWSVERMFTEPPRIGSWDIKEFK